MLGEAATAGAITLLNVILGVDPRSWDYWQSWAGRARCAFAFAALAAISLGLGWAAVNAAASAGVSSGNWRGITAGLGFAGISRIDWGARKDPKSPRHLLDRFVTSTSGFLDARSELKILAWVSDLDDPDLLHQVTFLPDRPRHSALTGNNLPSLVRDVRSTDEATAVPARRALVGYVMNSYIVRKLPPLK